MNLSGGTLALVAPRGDRPAPGGGNDNGDGGWFSAATLAGLALPGVPRAKRSINELAERDRWALQVGADGSPLARQRPGRGGGVEYHVSVLPAAARAALVKRGLIDVETPQPSNVTALPPTGSGQLWAWYDRQPASVKAEATRRAAAIDAIERLGREGLTRTASVATVGAQTGVSGATLFNWLRLIASCSGHDRLPNLAPRRQGGGREAAIDPEFWAIYRSDYLRFEKPTHSSCYRRLARIAAEAGATLPCAKTFERRLEAEVPPEVVVACRSGAEAVRKLIPAQTRSVANLHAMELVNIDGHKWDVFVRWPDGHIARPMMVAIQDVYSRKFLSWKTDATESAVLTRLAFAELFRTWGIPTACLMDNGRAFASKWITGGAKTRFRFKVRADEPLGLLTQLDIRNHWATPYRGQSKPIERGFRDFCADIAKHPAFAGAYTGNSPLAKPENYASKAVDLAVFERVIAQEIAAHNARPGRRTEVARGESFDEVFARSYATAPIGKATPEQLRLALLTADRVRADRATGALTLFDNRYWGPELSGVSGQLITVRFDPENLHSEVHAYRADGTFIATVPLLEATGFLDVEGAKARAKLASDHGKAVRRQVELQKLLSADDLAARMPGFVESDRPRPTVLRPVRTRGGAAAAAVAAEVDHSFNERFMRNTLRLVPSD